MSQPINDQEPDSQDALTARSLEYQQVQSQFPEAWEALPECYQNDSCLLFYLKGGELQADHDILPETYIWTGEEWQLQPAHKR